MKNLIAENAAPVGAKRIGVYNKDGAWYGTVPLGGLRPLNREKRLYSFGLIADPHVGVDATKANVCAAMTWFAEDPDVAFVVICGDLVDTGLDEAQWKLYEDTMAVCSKPIYALSGNHEQWSWEGMPELLQRYTGFTSALKAVEYGGDVFLFLGCNKYWNGNDEYSFQSQIYSGDGLRSIERKLQEFKDRRCFMFQHVQPDANLPEYDFSAAQWGHLPLSVFRHHKNITVFHGHTHYPFSQQKINPDANYDQSKGFRSVHVPSTGYMGQGYIVDVYERELHLRGMDFTDGVPMAIGTYVIDTTLQDVGEYTYEKQEE